MHTANRSFLCVACLLGGLALVPLLAGAPAAQAQTLTPVFLIEGLSPEKTGPTVRALKSQNALSFQAGQLLPAGYDFPSVNVNVAFQGDTHILTTEGMRALRTLAVALQDPAMQGQSFQIAAHVFSEGLASAQFPVSTRRAQTVVEHLTVYYGLPVGMLFPVGYGATKPVNTAYPYSPENTRIELINVTSP